MRFNALNAGALAAAVLSWRFGGLKKADAARSIEARPLVAAKDRTIPSPLPES